MLGPGYTQENGFLIGGGALYTFSTNKSDSVLQRSSIPLKAFYSTKGNYGLSSTIKTFWRSDLFRGVLDLNFENANDNYFGVGIVQNQEIPQSDSTSAYFRKSRMINPEIKVQFLPNSFLGIHALFKHDRIVDVNPIMAEDPYFLAYGNDIFSSGIGGSLSFDTRDLTVNAWRGVFLDFRSMLFRGGMGSDYNYETYELDLRTYQRIVRKGSTLAIRYYLRAAVGDVPYTDMSFVGGGKELRGYLHGQYRDKVATSLTCEWRHSFLKADGDLSKSGMALWVATGSVAPTVSEITEWLPNFGIGYRYAVQPRMNVRIDFGIGENSSGLYFGINEVF
ncbi:MAG: BamA/TamA family outer membrane protein [Algoriphagus sp.]